ncbi:hypothetical protein BH10BAC4_BH10BAC4_21880 [soil metagenome]
MKRNNFVQLRPKRYETLQNVTKRNKTDRGVWIRALNGLIWAFFLLNL